MEALLSNTGNAALTISSIQIGGTNPTDFAFAGASSGSNACGASLAAGSTCGIYITFTPASATSFTATLTVTDNATPTTQSVTLNGMGLALLPTPTFTPATGSTIAYGQSITISDSVSGATPTIYYTTNGTTPTTSSTSCNAPCAVPANSTGSSETIEALASYPSQYTNSTVATATYTLVAPSFTLVITGVCTATSTCSPLGSSSAILNSSSGQAIPVTLELSLTSLNGYNTPVTISSQVGSNPNSLTAPSVACVSSMGAASSCVYTPSTTPTTADYAFYYGQSSGIVAPNLSGRRARLATLGLVGGLLILVCAAFARWRRAARMLVNLSGLMLLIVSLGTLVGGCELIASVDRSTIPVGSTTVTSGTVPVTITATPNSGTAPPQSVTVYLIFHD
jgi:hypothetical protein